MKIAVTLVGTTDHHRRVEWPDGWPVPREGDTVTLNPEDPAITTVRTVFWYPEGTDEDAPEPFVYLVLGPSRP